MTQTAAPERAVRIPQIGDRVIVTRGRFETHQGLIRGFHDAIVALVTLDVSGTIEPLSPEEYVYPDGSRPESYEERGARIRTTRERTQTLRRLHAHTKNLRPVIKNREAVIIMMAARYGAAERLKGGDCWDLDLSYRAADRRFKALQRLVYGD